MGDSGRPVPRLIPGNDGVQVEWQGRRLLSAKPVEGQRRRLPGIPDEQTLYLILSPLLGQGLSDFLKDIPRSSAALLLEFEPALADLRRHPLAIGSKISADWITDLSLFSDAVEQTVRKRGIRRVQAASLSGGSHRHRDAYRRCERTANDLVQRYWKNRGTEIRLGRRWISNIWKNAPLRTVNYRSLHGTITPTVILVGAGPSLDYALPLLRRAHSLAVPLVAIDTALPSLAAADLPVDIVISMDGQLANAADLMPWKWDSALLLSDLSCHHSVVRRFSPERRVLFSTHFSRLHLLNSPVTAGIPRFIPRGSVAPTAVEILYRLFGVEEIIAVGLDFWYRLPRTHSSLAMHHRHILSSAVRTTGNDGPAAWSNRPWVECTLKNGTPGTADGVLADQAEQLRHLLKGLYKENGRFHLYLLPGEGLDIGGEVVSLTEAEKLIEKAGETPLPPLNADGTDPTEERRDALKDYLQRLRVQEEILADAGRPVRLDAGLDFAWFDLPQWPLVNLRGDWAEMHRASLLRAVRDHRRRIYRGLKSVDVSLPDFP